MKYILSIVFALALGSCGSQPDPDVNAPDIGAATNEVTSISIGKQSGSQESTASPAIENNIIPAALQGRWGMNAADCTSTRGDAKGLLTITEKHLKFYESKGTLDSFAEHSPTRILAEFAFTGEGMAWNRRIRLEAKDGGAQLIRHDYGDGADAGPFLYIHCKD